ncbi:MAG: 50S ribosomal protein L3 [Chloroflexi bacterium]|nr:50S ribosomal protein L3 [Chloroflexota bacterium]MCL5109938.1 50S ribosomal protein L3 [Chloroflexota bacterium]
MVKGLLGRKVGMTQVFSEAGQARPATVIEAGPCVVTQVRTKEKDGYEAVQIGFGEAKRLNKPERGHLKGLTPLRYLREVEAEDISQYEVGQQLDVTLFSEGERVDVIGVSKGHGFAGVVKRHHFRGGPKTHGQSDRWRAPGSSGSGTTPGRVLKGTRRAGHMGHQRVTTQNLEVLQADPERNLLLLKGSVPGPKEGLLLIRKAIKGEF